MRNEGVPLVEPVLPDGCSLKQTLLCFVLVGPDGGHVFCSRYDFGPWPLLQGAQDIPPHVQQVARGRVFAGFFSSVMHKAYSWGVSLSMPINVCVASAYQWVANVH